MASPELEPTEVVETFKALGDPIRWSIMQQMAQVAELPCAVLEDTLPVSKPTISYHTKILVQAGLISVRKEGRNFFYTLNRDVLRSVVDQIWLIAPEPRPVREGRIDHAPTSNRRRRQTRQAISEPAAEREAVVLTW